MDDDQTTNSSYFLLVLFPYIYISSTIKKHAVDTVVVTKLHDTLLDQLRNGND